MSLATSRHALERLGSTLRRVRSMLVSMEQSPSYLMLVDAAPGSATNNAHKAALTYRSDLWPMLDAATVRHTEAEAAADDERAMQLLISKGDISVPFGGSPKAFALAGLVEELRNRVEAIQHGVDEIDDRWQTLLPRVTAARETLERLEAEVAALGITEPLISMTARKADALAETLVVDPLGVAMAEGAELDLLVTDAARQLANLRVSHDNLDADLNSTEELLAALRVLRGRADASYSEAVQKVAEPKDLIHPPSAAFIDGEGGLAAQLDELFAEAVDGRWEHKRARLDKWLSSAKRAQAQLERATVQNRQPLAARAELRGRLSAYQSKMAARGRAEDLVLAELVDEIHDHLYRAPSDLNAADAAIGQLAEALRI